MKTNLEKSFKSEGAMVYFAVAFASGLLEKVDKAHDINHAKRVYLHALKILDSGIKADREVVLTCAVLHDIVDHKLFKNDENLDDFFAIYPLSSIPLLRAG